jgi:hypothetical protein
MILWLDSCIHIGFEIKCGIAGAKAQGSGAGNAAPSTSLRAGSEGPLFHGGAGFCDALRAVAPASWAGTRTPVL